MPEQVSILQLTGAAALALATVIWVVGLVRLLRGGRGRSQAAAVRHHGDALRHHGDALRHHGDALRHHGDVLRHHGDVLRAMPRQRRSGPDTESVELTPQEHAAFAGLVRQFSESRP
ncbi:hypothetical protein ACFWFF_29435 [Streptomyces sp. NPDC060223]|uniref:hypothetical protein n=1 Tax=unclassified Streptomyces TaxID=2593676 RepID=UPI00362901C5